MKKTITYKEALELVKKKGPQIMYRLCDDGKSPYVIRLQTKGEPYVITSPYTEQKIADRERIFTYWNAREKEYGKRTYFWEHQLFETLTRQEEKMEIAEGIHNK